MNLHHKLVRYAGAGAVALLTAALAGQGPADADGYYSGSARIASRTLQVIGTNADDDVVLTYPADGSAASVSFTGGRTLDGFDRKQFDSVVVVLGNGDDNFRVATGAPQTDSPVTVFGNRGDDVLQGGNGKDTLYGGRGNDLVDGGLGVDTEFLGSGDDTALWVPGEASDVVRGDSGADSLGFFGGPGVDTMRLDATGTQAVFFREPGGIRMDLNSVESIALRPAGGADRITVTGTEAPESVDVRAVSGTIDVAGLSPRLDIIGAEQADLLQVSTLGGRDSVTVHRGVSDLITTSVDLGVQ